MSNRERVRLTDNIEEQTQVEDLPPSFTDPNYPLTAREDTYCREYMTDTNQTQAAIRAGYSERSAAQIASRIMRKANVQRKIQSLMDERNERLKVNADGVIRNLMLIAGFNIADCVKWTKRSVSMIPSEELPKETTYCINQVTEKISKNGERHIGIKVESKLQALQALGKHFGLFIADGNDDEPKDFVEKLRKAFGDGNYIQEEVDADADEEDTASEELEEMSD